MNLLLQFHNSVVEVEGRGICAEILWCKYLLCNGLEASPVIVKIKVVQCLHYDIAKSFWPWVSLSSRVLVPSTTFMPRVSIPCTLNSTGFLMPYSSNSLGDSVPYSFKPVGA